MPGPRWRPPIISLSSAAACVINGVNKGADTCGFNEKRFVIDLNEHDRLPSQILLSQFCFHSLSLRMDGGRGVQESPSRRRVVSCRIPAGCVQPQIFCAVGARSPPLLVFCTLCVNPSG